MPLYLEGFRVWELTSVGAGVMVDLTSGGVGPEVALGYAGLTLRAAWLHTQGWSVLGGLTLKLPTYHWVQSR